MEPTQITPEPDEAERKAILAALAAEAAERTTGFRWAEEHRPADDAESAQP